MADLKISELPLAAALGGTEELPVVQTLITSKSTIADVLAYMLANGAAPIASPAFTGTPTTTTPGPSDDSTQIANTAWVRDAIDAVIAFQDAVVYKGAIDASSNPNYPAADAGWLYKISVGGKIGGASGQTVNAGDMIICTTDGTASGNQATVGSFWNVIDGHYVESKYTKGAQWTNLGAVIVAGDANIVYRHIQTTGTITKWIILTEGGTGSCQIDVWKDTYANYPPTVLNTITAASKPNVVSSNKAQDTVLTGWTTTVTEGDIIAFKLESSSVFTSVSIDLEIQPT